MTSPPPLPKLVVVADSSAARGRPLAHVVRSALEGGAPAIWAREKHVPAARRRQLVEELLAMARQRGALLISSSGPGGELADGCQLDASEAWPAWCAPGSMVGRSCHSPAELARAAAEGCRWATLSPVFASCSKPAYGPPLGLGALAGSPLPTWALGGVGAPNAARCLRAGAAGIAVMGAVMGADDPARAVAGILGRIEKMAV